MPFPLRCLPLLLCLSIIGGAAEWSRYRGPNGSGVADDASLPAELAKDKALWKAAVPKGNSSPITAAGKVILTAFEGDQRLVLAFDEKTGREVWRTALTKTRDEQFHPLNGPATPTAAADNEQAYVFFPDIGLAAFSLADGKERWRVPLGPFSSIQGIANSPICAGGKVILLTDQPEESVVTAYDPKNGRQRWVARRPSGFLGGYSTPAVYKPAKGPEQLVIAAGSEVTGYQLSNGEKLWWARGVVNGPAALPVVEGDVVYTVEPAGEGAPPFSSMANFDKNKDGRIALDELTGDKINEKIYFRLMRAIDKQLGNGDGAVDEAEWNKSFDGANESGGLVALSLNSAKGQLPAAAKRWRITKGQPYVTSVLAYQGVLYVIRNGGILTSYDPADGKVLKQARVKDGPGDYYASPVAAKGKIYLASKDGKLSVVQAGAQWESLSSVDFEEQIMATPAIAGNRLIVRTDKALYCFGEAK